MLAGHVPLPLQDAPVPHSPIVLFDLDGTLIDSIQLILKSAEHAFAERVAAGRPGPTRDEWLAGVGRPLATMFRQFAESDEEVDRLTMRYREYQLAHHDRLMRAYAGVPEMLATLRANGHRLGIVTSKGDAMARRGLDHVGILQHFEVIVGCDSSTRHKPDPEPVHLALERLGARPSEAAFVGDSVHDMEAGRAAEVVTIAALWGPFPRATLEPAAPSFYAEMVSDVVRFV